MKDENGTGLLHKAVYYNHRDIVDWLIDKYPDSMGVRDTVSTLVIINVTIMDQLSKII